MPYQNSLHEELPALPLPLLLIPTREHAKLPRCGSSLEECSKNFGKRTRRPSNHCGRGMPMSSRLIGDLRQISKAFIGMRALWAAIEWSSTLKATLTGLWQPFNMSSGSSTSALQILIRNIAGSMPPRFDWRFVVWKLSLSKRKLITGRQ